LNFVLIALFLCTSVNLIKLKVTNRSRQSLVSIIGKLTQPNDIPLIEGFNQGLKLTFTNLESGAVFTAKVNGDGSYSITVPAGRYKRIVTSLKFRPYASTVCIKTIPSSNPRKHVLTLIPLQPIVEMFKIRGYIKNATTNKLFDDETLIKAKARVVFINKLTKEKYESEILKGSVYEIELPKGSFERSVTAENFADMVEIVEIKGSSAENDSHNIIFLSPAVRGFRSILIWGRLPQDLDSHVVLPDGSEVNFNSRISGDKHVTLDVDALKGYGPETVTFEDLAPGLYKFYVNRFTNEAPLSQSNAKVRIFKGNKMLGEYSVPTDNDIFENWHVFNIDTSSDSVQIVNKLIESPPVV